MATTQEHWELLINECYDCGWRQSSTTSVEAKLVFGATSLLNAMAIVSGPILMEKRGFLLN